MGRRPLLRWSDDEIEAAIEAGSEHVSYYYNDLVAELDRRAAARQARASQILSVVAVVIAVAATIVTALKS